ncbi:sigma-70 family RNA polymerase sigma factor [Acidocella sp.]|uniref:sigma-70 family RNA polymerase sigma factor n=1 Tax=Acidocella sp. TaxID=50710 RepID=UPI0026033876|nr:sigma-70 family RNA polymerase sigma factor [Acidocella sp.]MDD2795454.1 sigma-70 family RNA polymerase sigma factor [Acidocella sp.]
MDNPQPAFNPDQPHLSALYGGWIKRTALLLKSRMPWAELDELLQWGAIGMLEAMSRFDRDHGVAFEAFAARRIRGAMIDGLRRDGAQRRGEFMLDADKVDTAAFMDGTSPDDPLALLLRADARHLLAAALKTLPALEYQVLALHFYDEMNNREIAAILDMSEGYASRIRKRALESLAIYMHTALKGETVS